MKSEEQWLVVFYATFNSCQPNSAEKNPEFQQYLLKNTENVF